MNITSDDNMDILLDGVFQPVTEGGVILLASGDQCLMQDIMIESGTEEGELFDETEEADESYGFGLLDFAQEEMEEDVQSEIMQRIREKLIKRDCIDEGSIQTQFCETGGKTVMHVSFCKNSGSEFSMDLQTEDVEVVLDD